MKWVTILFTLFIVLIIVLADTGNLGMFAVIYRIPHADKVGHFILYGILALLVNLTLFRSVPLSPSLRQSRIRVAVFSGVVLALLIGLEELSQQKFSNRTSSLSDLTASYLGVIFFSWLAIKTKK
jgi:VanZ family protein